MANKRQGNTITIDTTGAIANTNRFKVAQINLSSGAAAASLVLRDSSATGAIKWTIKVPANNDSKKDDISSDSIRFEGGIHATIAGSGAEANLIIRPEGTG